MPRPEQGLALGDRVAMARKVAGLNQQALAQRANYSISMLRAVEQGREPGSPAFVAAVARALGIEAEELYGQPYRGTLDDDGGVPPGLAELRTLFAEGRYALPLDPGSPEELEADLGKARDLRHSDRARQAIEMTPSLLRRMAGAIHQASTDSGRERGYRHLAQAYGNTAQLVYRFGWIPLATQAVDLMELAAERSDDPLLAAHAVQHRALILMSCAAYDTSTRLVQHSLGLLESRPDSEEVLALRGSAHLRGAMISARACELDRAREHIAEARVLGQRLGRSSAAYDTNFGPGNVEIHDVAVSLEGGDPGKAARDGFELRLPDDMRANRVGHHWQDVARAWVLANDHTNALRALSNARRAAPQQTRYHPQVRETARAIAMAERRKSDSIAHFTNWLGLKV